MHSEALTVHQQENHRVGYLPATLLTAAALAFLTPAVASPNAKALTDEVVALASAKQCGYTFDRASAIGSAYGNGMRKQYERDFDVSPSKYTTVLAGAAAWIDKRLDELTPKGQTYYYFAVARVEPDKSKRSGLALFLPEVVTGFPLFFCGSGRSRKLAESLGNIGICRSGGEWAAPHNPPEQPWDTNPVELIIPSDMDATRALGGKPGDRAVILRVEGSFSGCLDRSASTHKVARFVPARVVVFGTNHGARWLYNARAGVGKEDGSIAYQKYAGDPITAWTIPPN